MLSKLFYLFVGMAAVVNGQETSAVAYVRNVASDDYDSLSAKLVLEENGADVRFFVSSLSSLHTF